MAFPPNRFPNRKGRIINKRQLSKLFLAVLKHSTSPQDWLSLVVIVYISVSSDWSPCQNTAKDKLNVCVRVLAKSSQAFQCMFGQRQERVVFLCSVFYLKSWLIIIYYCLSVSYLCSIFVFLIFHPSVLFAWPPSSTSACVHAWNVMGRIGTTELSLK